MATVEGYEMRIVSFCQFCAASLPSLGIRARGWVEAEYLVTFEDGSALKLCGRDVGEYRLRVTRGQSAPPASIQDLPADALTYARWDSS